MSNRFPSNSTSDANDSSNIDEEWLFAVRISALLKCCDHSFDIIDAIFHINNLPSTSLHLGIDILSIDKVDRSVTGDLIVVIYDGEVIEFQMTCVAERLAPNSLLHTRTAHHAPGVVRYH